ncbi:phosphoglycerol geranylgeranyltransferase [Algoriphagus sediminis]|uniref:Geranylgeranylglyceryl phosphate synthase n=1 Tax=Algoriphagus sediminis TaxID=3057113 RepID=A0ABT7YCE6_9BACT|nr:phosphoglycerol geranylgeranyltransferase [Algoriphagus sediminis]MDN3204200.1 phosphoglycerol geranylgeranyltransferase [Algoriphagus sediminis]
MARIKGKIFELFQDLHLSGRKAIAWLIDPDKVGVDEIKRLGISRSQVDFIFVGGSQMQVDFFDEVVSAIKAEAGKIPVILFPGSHAQLSQSADGILFLSLLSGRNPRFLIEEQVKSSRQVEAMDLEVLATAYLLVNDGQLGSVHYASDTLPILNSNVELAVETALAGKYLGMKLTYLDAGSGSPSPVNPAVISEIKSAVNGPLIVGGGLDTIEKCKVALDSGADLLVLGNAIEKDPSLLAEVLDQIQIRNFSLNVN